MTADEIDLRKLSTPEKLHLMDALWEDLSRGNTEIPSPAWHYLPPNSGQQAYFVFPPYSHHKPVHGYCTTL